MENPIMCEKEYEAKKGEPVTVMVIEKYQENTDEGVKEVKEKKNATEYMREWKRQEYAKDPKKILTKNKSYYIKYKYNLTGDEMQKYGDHLPLVMKIKKGLEELTKVKPDLIPEILAGFV
jgi:hypothetical protein